MEVSYALTPSGEPPPCKRALTRALEDWDIVTCEAVLEEAEYQAWIGEHGWELVPLIAGYLTPHTEEAGPHLTACCQALLTNLAGKVSSAKEVLMALLEQLDQFKSSLAVTRLLPALGISLLRIKERTMSHSWAWALSTLRCHLTTVAVPINSGLEGAERLVIDLGPESREAAHLAAASCDLIQPLVDFVCKQDEKGGGENGRRKMVLVRFLVNLLGRPLSLLSQHPEVSKEGLEVHPATWATMDRACKFLTRLTSNLVTLEVEEEKGEEVESTGLPTVFYWVLGECQQKEVIPQVYSHLHLLHLSCPHICLLLSQTEEMRVHKGLILLCRRLEALPLSSLLPEEAENPTLTSLVVPLTKVIIHHDVKEVRQLGFTCYRLLLSAFSLEGRYTLFLFLLNNITHSGLLGWTVTQVKESVSASLNPNTSCSLYHGPGLVRLANKIYTLEQGAETDLLEASHHVLDTINFSVFLLTRDKENITGGKTLLLPQMKEWTEKLTTGLDLSVAHYRQRLVQPEEESGLEVQAQVGGIIMPKMDKKQKVKVIKDALNTFDLIQFNLVRLRELLGL